MEASVTVNVMIILVKLLEILETSLLHLSSLVREGEHGWEAHVYIDGNRVAGKLDIHETQNDFPKLAEISYRQ